MNTALKREYTISIKEWKERKKANAPHRVNAPVVDEGYTETRRDFHTPVQPLSAEQVAQLKDYFFNGGNGRFKTMPNNCRNYMYVVLSLNLMRRCGDMIQMRVKDVIYEDGTFRDHVVFHEQKTGKRAVVYLNSSCREALAIYFDRIGEYKMNDWLFPNFKSPGTHMTVDGMRKVLKRACDSLGIDINVGTHSLRKTMPYLAMGSGEVEDELIVSQLLNHRNIKTTYHYIGRTQSELDDFVEKFSL